MATYRKISGVNVKSYSTDPDRTYPSGMEGKLYYNSSDGQFKYVGLGAGAWSSGGNLNTGRSFIQGTGTATAGIACGGRTGSHPSGDSSDGVELYNGSTWSETTENNTARDQLISGAGTQTSTMIMPGYIAETSTADLTSVEEWDGSSWTEVSELNNGRYVGASFSPASGVGSAMNYIGGGSSHGDKHESWNGSGWTEIAEINTARIEMGRAGTSTAALIAGGEDASDPSSDTVESWNGSAWTEVAEVNTGRRSSGSSGTQTSAMVYGSIAATYMANCETWDGTSWTEVGDLGTARGTGASSGIGTGNNSTAWYAAGRTSDPAAASTATEEWSFSHAFKKVTTS